MGLMLMLYEYQTCVGKSTLYERESIELNNKQDRYKKRIEKVTELFNKRDTAIENKYKQYSSRMSSMYSTCKQATNTSAFIQMLSSQRLGNISLLGSMTSAQLQSDVNSLTANQNTGSAGATASATTSTLQSAFATICSNLETAMSSILEAMKEVEKDQLDETKEAQLGPLEEKDTEIECRIATLDTLIKTNDARKDNAEQRLNKHSSSGMATYGKGGG